MIGRYCRCCRAVSQALTVLMSLRRRAGLASSGKRDVGRRLPMTGGSKKLCTPIPSQLTSTWWFCSPRLRRPWLPAVRRHGWPAAGHRARFRPTATRVTGPVVGLSRENGMCVCEFSIPLQDSAFGHYSLGTGAGTGLNLTVTAGPSAEMRRAMQEQMRPHGRGGIGGGAGPGGPRRGPQGGQAATNPSQSVAVRLADGP